MAWTATFLITASLFMADAVSPQIEEQTQADSPATLEAPRCVQVRNVNGYSVIDDRHVLLNGGASRHYLVTTRNRCPDLRFGMQLGFSFGRTARLCRPFIEHIVTGGPVRCSIETIEEVENRQAAQALIDARAAQDDVSEDR